MCTGLNTNAQNVWGAHTALAPGRNLGTGQPVSTVPKNTFVSTPSGAVSGLFAVIIAMTHAWFSQKKAAKETRFLSLA